VEKFTFIALPHYGDLAPEALPGLTCPSRTSNVLLQLGGGSLLALVFNRLWTQALNERDKGLTHFAMHHADIQAPPYWVDTLLEEQERVGADVLSVVIPIKDARGLTSTGTRDPDSGNITRLTMKEACALPETFSILDTTRPEHWLMINTGLWICDFTKPWVEEVCFSILDATKKREDGTFTAHALPEDWNFSGHCARKGLKVFATTKVKVSHHGRAGFTNDRPWGDWETDKGD
jgi:hypothetical protein